MKLNRHLIPKLKCPDCGCDELQVPSDFDQSTGDPPPEFYCPECDKVWPPKVILRQWEEPMKRVSKILDEMNIDHQKPEPKPN